MLVLILVLMEDGLRAYMWKYYSKRTYGVLILVLMEDGLRVLQTKLVIESFIRLNPCFNGRWSARIPRFRKRGGGSLS